MKKTLFFLLLVAMSLLLIACGNSHTHQYGEWITIKEAGCIDNGEMARYCSCGEMQYQVIYAKGWHTEVIDEGYDSTCTEYGITDGVHCSVCNTVIVKQTVINEFKHNWNTVTTEPTCTEGGYDTNTCLDCGFVQTSNQTDKLGHSCGNKYYTDNSFHWQECENCDYVSDKVEHSVDNSGACTVCEEIIGDTEGVLYDLSDDGSYAIVVGYSGTATKIKIANSYKGVPVTQIYKDAFSEKRDITSVIIPDGVTTIDDFAFYYCFSLTSVVIPDSVTIIGEQAFNCCYNLTSIVIPDSVTTIGNSAFSDCDNLTSIVIPDSVTTIGNSAFSSCTNLTFTEYGNCKYLGNEKNQYYALVDVSSKSLSTYTIHSDTKIIAGNTFGSCDRLKSIDIPDGVTSIGNYAFSDCDNLTSIVIPDSVTTIGYSAFYGCYNLTSVVIGNSVTTISYFAFANCENLKTVVIGNSVTFIDKEAFICCDNLTDVYYTGSKEQWDKISIASSDYYFINATKHYNYVPEN